MEHLVFNGAVGNLIEHLVERVRINDHTREFRVRLEHLRRELSIFKYDMKEDTLF